ncbi:MAG: hypothetical protein ACE5GO_05510, partial [Anaerolineales bacterium]
VWTHKTEIDDFYFTTNQDSIRRFLERHHVTYIIVGQLERAYYDGPGIEKFEQLNGEFWREVYRDGETAIYEVVDA